MNIINSIDILREGIKKHNKWAIYFNNSLDTQFVKDNDIWNSFLNILTDEFELDTDSYFTVLSAVTNSDVLIFNSKKQALKLFDLFNKKPIYSSGIYVCLISNKGEIINENT